MKILKNGGPCAPESSFHPVCCLRVATQQDAASVEAGAKKAKVDADITAPVDSMEMSSVPVDSMEVNSVPVSILPPAAGAAATMSIASQFH